MLVPPSSDTKAADADAPPICSDYDCADPTWPEQACTIPEALITSGGGFSDYSDRASTASWQDKVVSNYLSDATVQSSLPDASSFNSTNRGFPDISAVGHNYMIYCTHALSLGCPATSRLRSERALVVGGRHFMLHPRDWRHGCALE